MALDIRDEQRDIWIWDLARETLTRLTDAPVLRDFFARIFLTFLLVSFTLPPIGWLHLRTRMPRALCTVALYALLFAALVGFLWYAVPQVVVEASTVADQLRTLKPDLIEIRGLVGRWVPSIQPAVDLYLTDERVGVLTGQFRAWTVPMLRQSAIFAPHRASQSSSQRLPCAQRRSLRLCSGRIVSTF